MPEPISLHPPRQVVIFRVGEVSYALDIESVREILPSIEATPVPGAPAGTVGIATLRGSVVPMFDLHWKFGVSPAGTSGQVIVVGHAAGPVGLLVDYVEEVAIVPREAYQAMHSLTQAEALGFLLGCFDWNGRLVLWADHQRMIPAAVARAGERAA